MDELDGLTKGAVYHHFRSREEIMNAVGDRMFSGKQSVPGGHGPERSEQSVDLTDPV